MLRYNPGTSVALMSGISASKYGIVGDGSDESSKFQSAISNMPSGSKLILPANKTFYASGITSVGKNIFIEGNGSKIIQNSNATVFSFKGEWSFVETVSSIATVSEDYSIGDAALTKVSRLILSADRSAMLNPFDIVKIISDDIVDGAYPNGGGGAAYVQSGSERRKGEFAVVLKVTGTSVYLSHVLRETYTTSIRMAKLAPVSFGMQNLKFDVDPSGLAAGWNSRLISLRSAKSIYLDNLEAYRGYDAFIQLRGIFGGLLNNIKASNLENNLTLNRIGYGIDDVACEGLRISNSEFINVRHGYTCNTYPTSPNNNTDIEHYGRSYNTTLDNCKGFGNAAAAFDTHGEGENITFSNCTAVGGYRGNSSSGAGFGVRGRNINLKNCTAINCHYGFHIFEYGPNSTFNTTLDNCKAFGSQDRALIVEGADEGYRVKGVRVIGGYYETIGTSASVARLYDCEIEFIGKTVITSKIPSGSSVPLVEVRKSTVKIDDIELNKTDYAGTNGRFIQTFDDACIVKGRSLRLILGSAPSNARINNLIVGTANSTINLTEVTSDIMHSTINRLFGTTNYRLDFYSDDHVSQTATYTKSISTATFTFPEVGLTASPIGYYNLTLTINSEVPILSDGHKKGQIVVIQSRGSSTFTLTVKHGTTYNTNLGGSDIVLINNQSIMLLWDGTDWIKII